MTSMITLTSKHDGFTFSALRAAPEGRRRGGVIVLQEIFGLDRYVREDVARWSALGFEVLAPSLFDRVAPGFVADHDPPGFAAGRQHMQALGLEPPLSDIAACIEALRPQGPVFLVGYCYGGLLTWHAAAKLEGLAAASSYYGRLGEQADLRPRCPIICHFGRKDANIPADEVRAKLLAAHPALPVYVYEGSGHGFNNDGVPAQDPADARLARQRTLALFEAKGAL